MLTINNSHFYKLADGRQFVKPLNRHNSATIRWIAIKFGTNLVRRRTLTLAMVRNLNFKKSKMAGG